MNKEDNCFRDDQQTNVLGDCTVAPMPDGSGGLWIAVTTDSPVPSPCSPMLVGTCGRLRYHCRAEHAHDGGTHARLLGAFLGLAATLTCYKKLAT